MTDDLIARLRSVDVSWSQTGEWCAEAADRIKMLEAELKRYGEEIGQCVEVMEQGEKELLAQIEALEAENERLREALWEIEMFTNGYGDVAGIVHKMAGDTRRAALEGTSHE